jgi:4-amino-4-deoxy-L-arabinose transferase-like glycosyltransferase
MTKITLQEDEVFKNVGYNKRGSISKPLLSSLANTYVIMAVIFAVGFVLRLSLAVHVSPYPERFIQADAVGYDLIAVNMLSGNGFSREADAPYPPDNLRTLIYPLFIAFHYAIFGHRPELVLYSQAFIGGLTVFAVFYIGKLVANPKIGMAAAGLFALSPHSITYTALLWSDTLYTFLLSVAIVFTILMLKDPSKTRWIYLSGLIMGLATFSHPRSLYLPLLFTTILLIVRLENRIPLRQVFIHVGTYILIFNLVLVPWRLRNYTVFGVPNVSSVPGVNMYFYGAALMEASRTGEEHWVVVNRYERELMRTGNFSINEAEASQLAFDLALKKISKEPLLYLRTHAIGTLKVFLPGIITFTYLLTGQNNEYRQTPFSLIILTPLNQNSIENTTSQYTFLLWGTSLFTLGYLFAVYALTAYTAVTKRKFAWVWFFLLICAYLALVAGPAGTPRFQLPLIPLLCVLAVLPFFSRKVPKQPGKPLSVI